MKTNILFPLTSRSHDLNGKLNIGALMETFYKYWNLSPGTVSKRGHAKFATDRARIMSRAYQYPYPLPKHTDEPKKETTMTDKSVSEGRRRLVFAVPASVAEATEAAAQQDLASISYICRRALLADLRQRGLLTEKVV